MEEFIGLFFRFFLYVLFGLTLEVIFSVIGIHHCLGLRPKGRVPKQYLEGHVSLYMIPLHGLGVLFLYEWGYDQIQHLPLFVRYLFWAITFTAMEVIWGKLLLITRGFYTWDYYKESKYKVFKEGLTLWTLIPNWGIAGLMLEVYSPLLRHITPEVTRYLMSTYFQ